MESDKSLKQELDVLSAVSVSVAPANTSDSQAWDSGSKYQFLQIFIVNSVEFLQNLIRKNSIANKKVLFIVLKQFTISFLEKLSLKKKRLCLSMLNDFGFRQKLSALDSIVKSPSLWWALHNNDSIIHNVWIHLQTGKEGCANLYQQEKLQTVLCSLQTYISTSVFYWIECRFQRLFLGRYTKRTFLQAILPMFYRIIFKCLRRSYKNIILHSNSTDQLITWIFFIEVWRFKYCRKY